MAASSATHEMLLYSNPIGIVAFAVIEKHQIFFKTFASAFQRHDFLHCLLPKQIRPSSGAARPPLGANRLARSPRLFSSLWRCPRWSVPDDFSARTRCVASWASLQEPCWPVVWLRRRWLPGQADTSYRQTVAARWAIRSWRPGIPKRLCRFGEHDPSKD